MPEDRQGKQRGPTFVWVYVVVALLLVAAAIALKGVVNLGFGEMPVPSLPLLALASALFLYSYWLASRT